MLVGAPLILVLIFCFSFVLLHPVQPSGVRSSSSQTTDAAPAAPSADDLPIIPAAEASAQAQTLAPTSPAGEPSAIQTGTPQAATASSSLGANPQ
ncbi:MAG TPA: hypothetical protein VM535_00230, partial [Candidatus Saccharimonadales bacterium]|nr:hypothetical protein [Candidatus Saccharimonadales bacterium]